MDADHDHENRSNLDALVTLRDIQAVPIPPGIRLRAGGLVNMGIPRGSVEVKTASYAKLCVWAVRRYETIFTDQ